MRHALLLLPCSWSRHWLLLVLFLLIALPHASQALPKSEIHVLWTYTTLVTDLGFTFGVDQARSQLEATFFNEYGA